MTTADDAVDVSPVGDGGVVKRIATPAPPDARAPEKGDAVTVHYVGSLATGETFDSSRERDEAFTFTLGKHEVIDAWDVGVATMRVGERATLTCAPEYAYGDRGAPPKIPGGATLIFDVELLSFKSHRDLCGDGGVMKETVREGEGYASPSAEDEATATMEAKTRTGDETLVAKTTRTFSLAANGDAPCEGVRAALLKMKRGETARVTLSEAYAEGLTTAKDGAVVELTLDAIHAVVAVNGVEGATKKILEEGEGYETPNDGAKCEIEYEKRVGGATTETKPAHEIVVGDEHVPDELESAIAMMKLNEKALVKLADGTEYTVKMTKLERAKEQWSMNNAEKIEAAEKYKTSGNDAYKGGKFARATKKYDAALKFVEMDESFSDEEKQASKKLKLSLNLNSAAVAIKTKSWMSARKSSEKALAIEGSNEKALYRFAQAAMELQEYDESRRSLKKILEADESHAEATRMLTRLKALEAHQAKKDAKIFGGMFSKIDLGYEDVKVKADEPDEEIPAPEAMPEVPAFDEPPAPDANEPFGVESV